MEPPNFLFSFLKANENSQAWDLEPYLLTNSNLCFVIITCVAPHFKSIEVVLLLQIETTSVHFFSPFLFISRFEKPRKSSSEEKGDLGVVSAQIKHKLPVLNPWQLFLKHLVPKGQSHTHSINAACHWDNYRQTALPTWATAWITKQLCSQGRGLAVGLVQGLFASHLSYRMQQSKIGFHLWHGSDFIFNSQDFLRLNFLKTFI